MKQTSQLSGKRVIITHEESDHVGEIGTIRDVDEEGHLHIHDEAGEFMGLYALDDVRLLHTPELPRLVIEIEGGRVAAVYYPRPDVLCAIVDADQAQVGEDTISLLHTMGMEEVPRAIVQAIK